MSSRLNLETLNGTISLSSGRRETGLEVQILFAHTSVSAISDIAEYRSKSRVCARFAIACGSGAPGVDVFVKGPIPGR